MLKLTDKANPTPGQLKYALDRLDKQYGKDWLADIQRFIQMGIYSQIADFFVPPTQGGIHIDAGCGRCDLLKELHARHPGIAFVGVDRNSKLTEEAANSDGPLVTVHGSSEIRLLPGKMIETVFLPDEELHIEDLAPGEPIRVLIDDVRSMEALNVLLGNRGIQIQSASLSFPGTSYRSLFEKPYSYKDRLSDSDLLARRKAVSIDSRRRIFSLLSKLVETDGQLLLVDRFRIVKDGHIGQLPYYEDFMPENYRYWDFEEGRVINNVVQNQTSRGRGTSLAAANTSVVLSGREPIHVAMFRLRRNNLPVEGLTV